MSEGYSTNLVRARSLQAIRASLVDTVIPDLTKAGAPTSGYLILRLVDYLISMDADAELQPSNAAALKKAMPMIAGGLDGRLSPDLRAFVETETKKLIARDPAAAGGVEDLYLGGKKSSAEAPVEDEPIGPRLDEKTLTTYLRRRFPDHPELTVTGLAFLPGGMSKETIRVYTEEAGRMGGFVIRKDFPISPSMAGVADEFPMFEALYAGGRVPLAEPLWQEPDPSVFGTALFAVSMVEGSSDISAAVGDAEQGMIFADALAKAMARLHAMPLQRTTAGPLIDRDAKGHVIAEIERWYNGLLEDGATPEPALATVFAWLMANVPEQVAPSAIVHGDIGFHNMLMQDGRLTALLDWEFAHIGDPAEDLMYSRLFVEQVIDWPSFVQMYVDHGGVAPTPEQERFFGVWQSARNAAGCARAVNIFLAQPSADIKLAVSGLTFEPRFAIDALQKIVA
jgi:aminoglycoside phosphotransferase (APT) family kinase protein